MTTITTDPNTFHGYPLDLLRAYAGMGPALIGDDALAAAVAAFNLTAADGKGVGVFGPALLTDDATITVQSVTAHQVPDTVKPIPVVADDATASWDAYDLDGLLAKVAAHKVEIQGRVKTPGKLIAALEAAGVAP